jgi:hypothetical protein
MRVYGHPQHKPENRGIWKPSARNHQPSSSIFLPSFKSDATRQVKMNLRIILWIIMRKFDQVSFTTLIGLSQKIMRFSYSPNISIFYQYGTMVVLFQGISWMHIVSHLIAWVELLFLILFIIILDPSFCNRV